MLFEQVSTRRRQCTFWTQGRLQGCKARLSVGLEGLLGGTHRQHPEGWGCFPGTWASLLPEAPCQAEDAWSGGPGGVGRQRVAKASRVRLAVGGPCVPAEARAGTHAAAAWHWELGIFQPLSVEGLAARIEAGAVEGLGDFGGLWVGGRAHPCAFFAPEP